MVVAAEPLNDWTLPVSGTEEATTPRRLGSGRECPVSLDSKRPDLLAGSVLGRNVLPEEPVEPFLNNMLLTLGIKSEASHILRL